MSLSGRLDALYAIGPGPGAYRPAFGPGEDEAHRLVRGWMEEAALEVSVDAVGNLFGRLVGSRPDLPEVWSGSHLDSVPAGGRLDGPLGVIGALEAVDRIGRQARTLTVVAFRDEEGWRYGRGCFGSRAICGRLEPGELETLDAEGVALAQAIRTTVLPAQGWLERPPAAYVELHIEQGPVLAQADVPLAVVTSIVGLARLSVRFSGREGHAGTTPMAGRDDALCKAAAFVLAVRDAAGSVGDDCVATIGNLAIGPGAANVIPNSVEALVDARAPRDETLSRLLDEIGAVVGDASADLLRRTSPVPMAAVVQEALGAAARERGVAPLSFHSGAGHDAGVMGEAGIPSGMLFVRSLDGGISHSPDERSSAEDVELAVDVLAGALRRLAAG